MRTREELAEATVPPGQGADFVAQSDRIIVRLTPLSDRAEAWLGSHVAADSYWDAGALILEPRYFASLADAILDAGFRFERAA